MQLERSELPYSPNIFLPIGYYMGKSHRDIISRYEWLVYYFSYHFLHCGHLGFYMTGTDNFGASCLGRTGYKGSL